MTFSLDVHGPQRINPTFLGEPPILFMPPSGQILDLTNILFIDNLFQKLRAGNLLWIFVVPRGWILMCLVDPTDLFTSNTNVSDYENRMANFVTHWAQLCSPENSSTYFVLYNLIGRFHIYKCWHPVFFGHCWSVCHVSSDWSISTTVRWIAMKFCTDIHSPKSQNCDFGGPLTFSLEPPWGWHFWLGAKYLDKMDFH